MKYAWNYIMSVADSLYRARLAAAMSRQGNYQQARKIMLQD
jgi:hypothetical protein